MKISKYIETKFIGEDCIIFSTISRKIIKVLKSYYDEMVNINDWNLKEITSSDLKYLIESNFLVEDGIEENQIAEGMLDIDRLNQEIFSSYIAFSTLCNFACVYCYEEGQTERRTVMNEEVLNNVIAWYKRILILGRYKECKITLFGGEPLLHINLIKLFVGELFNYTKSNGIELKLALITNGYLLKQDIVTFLISHGLEEIQITLDGVGEVHDRRRPLRGGGDTFRTIIENVKALKKFDGRFLFRVSFDKSNISNVKKLLKYIKQLPIDNNYQVYLAPIHQTTSQSDSACSFCSKNTTEDIDILICLYMDLYRYMKNIGLSIPKYITNGPCMTVSKDSVLVDPRGKLFKCVEMIGIDNIAVGSVYDTNYDSNLFKFIAHPNFKKCVERDCKYVCLCGGGCLMKSYLKDASLNNLDCQYKLFYKLIPFLLELNYGDK